MNCAAHKWPGQECVFGSRLGRAAQLTLASPTGTISYRRHVLLQEENSELQRLVFDIAGDKQTAAERLASLKARHSQLSAQVTHAHTTQRSSQWGTHRVPSLMCAYWAIKILSYDQSGKPGRADESSGTCSS